MDSRDSQAQASGKSFLSEIWIISLGCGICYFVVSLFFFWPSEQLGLLETVFSKFNLFAYTFCFHIVGFLVLGFLCYLISRPLITRGRAGAILGRFIEYFILGLGFTLGLAVWLRFDRMAPLLPRYVVIADLRGVIGIVILIDALAALALSTLVNHLANKPKCTTVKGIAYLMIVCVAYIGFANLILSRGDPSGDTKPRKVVLLGIDAGTWNVALPFAKQGYLPTFRALMENGTYGYLDTYGSQFTPPVWTSIATGKVRSKHKVYHFGNLSSDWQAAPIWSIASSKGRGVGIVNWVCTWPPFRVKGAFISKVISEHLDRFYLSKEYTSYKPVAESLLALARPLIPATSDERLEYAREEARLLRTINKDLISKIDPELVACYYYSTDLVQHFFWKDMEPEKFIHGDWKPEEIDSDYSDAILEGWLEADSLLAELVATYGDQANYIVVSDHGARPVRRRMGRLDIGHLLDELGFLKYEGGSIDSARSLCYLTPGWSPYYRLDLKINPQLYRQQGNLDLNTYHELEQRVVDALRSLSTDKTHKPLFAGFSVRSEPGAADEPDISAYAAKVVLEMPRTEEGVIMPEGIVPLSYLVKPHPWSGRHRARGLIIMSGPSVRHRYTGAWVIDDGYTSLFRYMRGTIAPFRTLSSILRKLHIIDEATTLDITPTVLYLMGLPVGKDMDGRVLLEDLTIGEHQRKVEWIATWGKPEASVTGIQPHEELRRRLKALGYVQ